MPARDSWTREELKRARSEEFDVENGSVTIRFASPEDTLLHKLVWYKRPMKVWRRKVEHE